jgi:serine/threonine protein kinase
LLGTLARGGQGDVFLAVDTQLQRRVCIKVYRYDRGPRTRRHVELEAWRLAAIESPQVLRILDVVAHGGDLALVTSYVPGCSLQALLDRLTRLEPQEGLALASDIAAGLAALRRSDLVHGDVSARNVLITDRGRAVLADFGSVLRSRRTGPESEPAGLQSGAAARRCRHPRQRPVRPGDPAASHAYR